MATLKFETKIEGVLADVTSVVLSDPTGTYGIKRNDTGATVVAAGTAFTKTATGTYEYEFTEPEAGIRYGYYVKWVYGGATYYQEVIYTATTEGSAMSLPSAILAAYLIDTGSFFTRPIDDDSWPLYERYLPEDPDNAAVITDTVGMLDGRVMVGVTTQHYGLQIMVRHRNSETAWAKIAAVADALDLLHNERVYTDQGTFDILAITRTSSIAPLGLEKESTKRRYLYTANFIVALRMVSS